MKVYTKLGNLVERNWSQSSLTNYTLINNTMVHNSKLQEYQSRYSTRSVTPTTVTGNVLYINRYGVSESAKFLKEYLESEGITVKYYTGQILGSNHLLLDWGYSSQEIHGTPKLHISNRLNNIPTVNKIKTFKWLSEQGLNSVEYTLDKDEAKSWCDQGSVVYCRTIIDGQEGSGIIVARTPEEIVDAPLYSKKFKGTEFRCYFVNGKLVFTCQKRALSEESRLERGITLNDDIRNTNGGYIFSIRPNEAYKQKIVEYFSSKDMKGFTGGIDLICNLNHEIKILEMNSANGLTPVIYSRGERTDGTTTVHMGNEIIRIFEDLFSS